MSVERRPRVPPPGTATAVLPRRQRDRAPMSYWVRVTLTVLGVLLLAYLLYQVRSTALSVFLGFFLAVGFDPFLARLERAGMRRGLAVLVFFLLLFGVIAGFVLVALQPLVDQLQQLAGQVPALVRDLQDQSTPVGQFLAEAEVAMALQDGLSTIAGYLATSVDTVFGILGSLVGGLFTVFTILALTAYFMLALPRMRSFAHRALDDAAQEDVLEEALGKVGGYVSGQLTICVLAGVTSYVVLTVLGVPYAAVLAIAVALLDTLPQVGATIAAVLVTAVALTESWGLALAVALFFLVYQQLENYLIAPRVFSRAVNLSPVAVFIAILVGASLAGLAGALVALPVTAALKTVFRFVFRRQLAMVGAPPAPVLDPPGDEPVREPAQRGGGPQRRDARSGQPGA